MDDKYTHVTPAEIEKRSMEIISKELEDREMFFNEQEEPVIKRVIHATADFEYAETLLFTENCMKNILERLTDKDIKIVTDTNMALAGINKDALSKLEGEAICYMSEPEIAKKAKELGVTRAYVSMGEAFSKFESPGLVVGNAPTALVRICEEIEKGARPAFVIGVPVGFVNVHESKVSLLQLCSEHNIPGIVAMGRKGGSTVAAAIMNACLYMATESLDPVGRGWH